MKRINRDRYLSQEEADKYKRIREQAAQDLPELLERRMTAREENQMLTLDDAKKTLGPFKFVRVAGEYRLSRLGGELYHSDLVKKGEKAESAGNIWIDVEHVGISRYVSTSLGLGPAPDDNDRIPALLGLPLGPFPGEKY